MNSFWPFRAAGANSLRFLFRCCLNFDLGGLAWLSSHFLFSFPVEWLPPVRCGMLDIGSWNSWKRVEGAENCFRDMGFDSLRILCISWGPQARCSGF